MLIGNVLLAVAWTALNGEFSLTNLSIGFALGYVLIALLVRGGVLPTDYRDRTRALASLALFLCREFVVANVRMAIDVARSHDRLKPGIIEVPLDVTDEYELLLLTTLINMTPGSLSLDLSPDRRFLYVHVMDASDPEAARATIKNDFERRVMSVLR